MTLEYFPRIDGKAYERAAPGVVAALRALGQAVDDAGVSADTRFEAAYDGSNRRPGVA